MIEKFNAGMCILLTLAGLFVLVIIDHMQTSYPYGYGAEMTCTGIDAGICREALDD